MESDTALITYRRIKSDLLISILSFAYFPSAPVKLILSEPAKSTSSSFEDRKLSGLRLSIIARWYTYALQFDLHYWMASATG